MKRPKRPRDPNQLAKTIVDLAIGKVVDIGVVHSALYVLAVELGRLKGEKARAKKLSEAQ